eukprot:TRINITY_DN6404_c0_g1_i1.p1 TRINITY_DN6404_c0_g1~~TRINITY_DN6404_c0_g1_i1.p1  ORF type:complete len:466 (-),score=78.20 TRINITY_DN6404_c0_g1_i1:268-1665(-)
MWFVILISIILVYYFKTWRPKRQICYNMKEKKYVEGPGLLDFYFQFFQAENNGQLNENIMNQYGDSALSFIGTTPVIVTRDPQIIRYVTRNLDVERNKITASETMRTMLNPDSILAADQHKWKHTRKMMTIRDPTQFFGHMNYKADQLLESWENESEVTDIWETTKSLTMDILGLCLFGQDFELLNKSPQQEKFLESYQFILKHLAPHYLFKYWDKLPLKMNKKMHEHVNYMVKYITDLSKTIDPNTLLGSMLMDNDLDSTEYPMFSNVFILLMSGHETTATAIHSLLFLLSKHEDIQDSIRNEILEMFPSGEIDDAKKLKKLTYLRAVLKENTRMFPPTFCLIDRQFQKDTEIGDYIFKKNTILRVCINATNMDPRFWKEPQDFEPKRFLTNNMKAEQNCNLMTFGSGKRNCLGKHFAEFQMIVVVVKILLNFRVSVAEDASLDTKGILLPNRDSYSLLLSKLE